MEIELQLFEDTATASTRCNCGLPYTNIYSSRIRSAVYRARYLRDDVGAGALCGRIYISS